MSLILANGSFVDNAMPWERGFGLDTDTQHNQPPGRSLWLSSPVSPFLLDSSLLVSLKEFEERQVSDQIFKS